MTVVYKPMHAVQIAVRIATVQLTNLIYIYIYIYYVRELG